MPAHEKLNNLQFRYSQPDLGESFVTHQVTAIAGPTASPVGTMLWTGKHGVRNIGVDAQHQRRGVATAMWNEGHRLASEMQQVPQPRHSPDRTAAGDAWAKSVGGRLPRRREG